MDCVDSDLVLVLVCKLLVRGSGCCSDASEKEAISSWEIDVPYIIASALR